MGVAIDKATIDTKLAHSLKNIILIALVVFIAGGLVLLGTTHRILRPLEVVAGISEHISAGDLTRRCEIDANNEIGALAKSFNEMGDKQG